jgi:hypothetical protein
MCPKYSQRANKATLIVSMRVALSNVCCKQHGKFQNTTIDPSVRTCQFTGNSLAQFTGNSQEFTGNSQEFTGLSKEIVQKLEIHGAF